MWELPKAWETKLSRSCVYFQNQKHVVTRSGHEQRRQSYILKSIPMGFIVNSLIQHIYIYTYTCFGYSIRFILLKVMLGQVIMKLIRI